MKKIIIKIIYSGIFIGGLVLPSLILSSGTFSLSNLTVETGTTTGTVVGNFSDTSATYSLVSGTGSEDNAKFTISGNELRLNFTPTYNETAGGGATVQPGTATASSVYSSNQPEHAFDDNTTTQGWGNNNTLPAWLKYDFGSGNSKTITAYTLYRSTNQSGGWGDNAYTPRTWTFEGSNDNSSWTVLDTQTNQSILVGQAKQTFSFSNTSAYRYYRINITQGASTWVNITEMELLESGNDVTLISASPTAQPDNDYQIRVRQEKPFNLQGATFPLDYSRAFNDYSDNPLNENGDRYYGGFYNANTYPSSTFSFAVLMPDGSIKILGSAMDDAPTDSGYVKIYSAADSFAALKSDGSITSWGGICTNDYPKTCVDMLDAPTDSGYVAVYSNANAFAALKSDGSITSWGHPDYGGTGAPTDSGYIKVYSIGIQHAGGSFGGGAFTALKEDGEVVCWGYVDYCSGAPENVGIGAKVYSTHGAFAALKSDGNIVFWGSKWWGGLNTSVYIGAGAKVHTSISTLVSLKLNNAVVSHNNAYYGYVMPTNLSQISKIQSSPTGFAALKQDGSITAWGGRQYNALGAPTDSGYTKIYSNFMAFAALKQDGSITSWGYSGYGGTGAPTDSGYTKIYSGYGSFAALKSDGSITSWGQYSSGAPTDSGYTKIYSTEAAFAALKPDGSVFCWGPSSSFGGTCSPPTSTEKTFTITVTQQTDIVPPVITLNGSSSYSAPVGSTFTDSGAVCSDNIDADKPATPTGTVDTSTIGSYTINYNCTDSAGNPATSVARTINIVPPNSLNLKLKLPTKTVQSGMSTGFTISNILTVNAPITSIPVYSLTTGQGDEDNSKFTIENNLLKLNFTPDFNNPTDIGSTPNNNSYSIRIKSVVGGSEVQKNFLVYVVPDNIILNDKYKCKGYGWSPNIGWLSLNCSNSGSCKGSDYGTSYDNTGELTGFAWNSSVGWLNNEPIGISNTSKIISNNFEGKSVFNSGIASLVDGWNGHLKFNGSGYGVSKAISGNLSGYSWGGDVVGWLGFPTVGKPRCANMLVSFTTGQEKGLTPDTKLGESEGLVLKWKTQNAVSCTALNGDGTTWKDNTNKSVSVSGEWNTETINDLSDNTNFTLECVDSAGNKEIRNLFVFVKPPKPEIRFWVTDTNIPFNTKAELNWEVKHVSECKATGSWAGSKSISSGVHQELSGNLNAYPTYTFTLECKSNSPDAYGTDWFRQDVLVDIAKLEVDIKAERNPLPFNDPIELTMESEFATQCQRTYTYVNGQDPLKADPETNVFTKPYFPVSFDWQEIWKSESVQQKSAYRFKFECKGQFGQHEEKEILLKVGNVPSYIES